MTLMTTSILPPIETYEEYELLKPNIQLFEKAAYKIIELHQLPQASLTLYEGTNTVFAYGDSRVIKIYPPAHLDQFTNESLVMQHLYQQLSVHTPQVEYIGQIDGWPYIVMGRLDGTLLEGLWENLDLNNKIIILRELGALIREVHKQPTAGLETIDCHWQQFIRNQINHCIEQQRLTHLPDNLIRDLPKFLEQAEDILPKINYPVLLTGEYTPMNLLVKQHSGIWHIHGLIDFGDCMLGLPEYDLLGPGAFLIQGNKQLLEEFLIAYGYDLKELNACLSHQLSLLMLLHKYSNLSIQIRIANWQNKVNTLADLENLVWGFNDH